MKSNLHSHKQRERGVVDVIGVGAGPANLSLAALARPIPNLRVAILERKQSFSWHPGNLFQGASVTTTPLKDLVSLVDPTSPLSFLNFLAHHGRLYRSLIADRGSVPRREFSEYFSWAAAECRSVHFGIEVSGISHDGDCFLVGSSGGTWRARNLVLGIGQRPSVPGFAERLLGPQVFHAGRYLEQPRQVADRDVLLVGGGQSAAEVALHVLRDAAALPRRFVWASSRHGFLPLDDSPFSNEWFNPRYTEYFHGLPARRREELLQRQLLASDGASQPALEAIYGRLYELDYLERTKLAHSLLSGHELVALRKTGNGSHEAILECHDTGLRNAVRADLVILATGYRSRLPELLEPLVHRLAGGGRDDYRIGPAYELGWDGEEGGRIFVQGGARGTHGVADPNLSLASWRSAVILNRICGRDVYPVDRGDITLALDGGAEANEKEEAWT